MYRTLIVLAIAQSFAQCGAPVVVLLAGIVGVTMAPSPEMATLPVALMIVGTAATTIPAALIMSRFGRKTGFMLGAAYAAAAGLLAAWAITISVFWLFCLATFLIGSHNAFIQQYRFAVAESVPPAKAGSAISLLMLAGVVAAFMGPEIAARMRNFMGLAEFAGSFIGVAILMMGAFAALTFYTGGGRVMTPASQSSGRSLPEFMRNPLFLLAVGAAVVGYSVMSLMMTATPVSMHTMDHFSLEDTTWVIQSHIIAMFLPSLASAWLIARFGAHNIVTAGLVLLFICLGVAAIDRSLLHYWLALVLLGVSWNFLFVGGTALLTTCYTEAEKYKVQALNDFLVFGLQAVAALGSGVILTRLGWDWILLLSLPWLVALLPLLWFSPSRQPLQTA